MICDADADSKRITYDWSRVDAAVASLYSEELFNNIGHVALPAVSYTHLTLPTILRV